MKKLSLMAVLAAIMCLVLVLFGCAKETVCEEEKMQNYYIDDMTMYVGETAQLPMASGKDSVVKLSQEGIVSVENGTIRALSAGTVSVTSRVECLESEFTIDVVDKSRTVTVNNGAGGTIEGVATGSYNEGDVLNVTITANAFNYIPTLKVNGEIVELGIATPEYTASFQVKGDTTVDVTYFDYTTRGSNATLAARRDLVEAESTRMATTLFYYDKDLCYESATQVFEDFALTGGRVYAGIPYTSGNQSLDAFMTTVKSTDGNGVNYVDTDLFFSPRWGFLYGASCADMAYWAQAQVSDTISYGYAANMTEATGLYKVGDYSYTTTTDANGKIVLSNTPADCTANGDQKMFEAYALLQKGDVATSWSDSFNHAIVIAGVYVERNGDGTINGNQSYVLIDDLNGNYGRAYRQNATSDTTGEVVYVDGQVVYTACRNNYKWTFNQIFNDGYLPMTCKELLTDEDAVGATVITDSNAGNLSFETLITGKLESNYYIEYATMEITDSEGNTVQSSLRYSNESDMRDANFGHGSFNMGYFAERHNFAWSTATSETYALYAESNMINPTLLESGSYHCTVTVYTGNGSVIVVRDFDFTV